MWASFSAPITPVKECGDDQGKTETKWFSCAPCEHLIKSDENENDTFHCALGLSKDRNMHGDGERGCFLYYINACKWVIKLRYYEC